MKKAITIAAIAGLAGTAAAQSTGISITASKTTIGIGESVTFTVTLTNDLAPGNFGWYLKSAFVNFANGGSAGGLLTDFTFQHSTSDLNNAAIPTPRALVSDFGDISTVDTPADVTPVMGTDFWAHWQVNNLNGDGVGDYIIGDVFETPYVLGTFTVQGTAEGILNYDVTADQDFIDTQGSVSSPINWGSGSLGLADAEQSFDQWSLTSDRVTVTPTPATAALLGLGGLAAARRRR